MSERELREALRRVPVDAAARERSRRVVRAAARELAPATRHARRGSWRIAAVAAACLLAALASVAATGTPTDALARWLRDAVGIGAHDARPLLGRVPGGGRLLVSAGDGAWVVAPDGAKRRLGRYAGASWSPRGLFVVAWQGGELTALEPDGDVRWSLRGADTVRAARWAPGDGFRIAYVAGSSLRIVDGDGTDDHRYAPARPTTAPAWRPGARHVLAWIDARGRVRVADVDARRELWRTGPLRDVRALAWAPDGRRLLVLTGRRALLLDRGGARRSALPVPAGARPAAATWAPDGRVALVLRDAMANRSDLVVVDPRSGHRRVLFTAPGTLASPTWSPGAGTLLVAWPDGDQWLFLSPHRRRRPVDAVQDVAAQFAPGAERARFPASVEWSPAAGP